MCEIRNITIEEMARLELIEEARNGGFGKYSNRLFFELARNVTLSPRTQSILEERINLLTLLDRDD